MEKQGKTKKQVYKRVWFWLLLSPAIITVLFVLTAIIVGISGGFAEDSDMSAAASTHKVKETDFTEATPTLSKTVNSTTTPTKTPKVTPTPSPTATPTATPTKTPRVTPTPRPTATPTVAPTKTPKPTSTQTPKPTPTSSPTLKPTFTPKPTVDPSDAPYGVDIYGNPGPDFVTLMTVFELWLEDYVGKDVEISYSKGDWDISKSNFRYIITTTCRIDYRYYDVIMKLEFDETYETYVVFQLKINGINMDI